MIIKPITRDIALTLIVKLLLLFLLWWVCVRALHPKLEKSGVWLLGSNQVQTQFQQAMKR